MRRRRLLVVAGLRVGGLAGALRLAHAQGEAPQRIEVVARKFEFEPNEITLRRGVSVELVLSAPEVVMGFHAPELKLRAEIVPGQPTRLRFMPAEAGRFEFHCDVFCGDGHEDMNGSIVVLA